MYFDIFSRYVTSLNRPQPWATFLRAQAVPEQDEQQNRDFFIFALSEETKIGNIRKTSEAGWDLFILFK